MNVTSVDLAPYEAEVTPKRSQSSYELSSLPCIYSELAHELNILSHLKPVSIFHALIGELFLQSQRGGQLYDPEIDDTGRGKRQIFSFTSLRFISTIFIM
jgi:hypothetical protein